MVMIVDKPITKIDYEAQYISPRVGRPRKHKKPAPVFKSTDSDIEELHGLSGGQKSLWLNVHREEVLVYLEKHGDVETRRHYGLKDSDALKGLMSRWFVESRNRPLTAERRYKLETEMLKMDMADLRKEIRELREQFALFRESVGNDLTRKFFIPLMKAAIHLEPELEVLENPPDPLNVKFITEHTKVK